MVYLVLGLAFIGLECWRLVADHPSGPLMPLWGRIAFPVLIAAGASRFKGPERMGVLAAAVIGLVIWNRYSIGDHRWLAAVVVGCGGFLVWVGYTISAESSRRTMRPLLWLVALVLVAFSVFYVVNLF